MRWVFTPRVEEYAAAAEPWLLADPVRNTVPLTVLHRCRAGMFAENPLLGWLEDENGTVIGAVSHCPPYPLLLASGMPQAALPLLASDLIELDRAVDGVTGPVEAVETFARSWWRPERCRRAERLYRLERLAPCDVPGSARTITTAELDEAIRWFRRFHEEADPGSTADYAPVVAARINREELIWWEDGGRRVAMAGVTAPIAGMSRVGPVYTPPELRGRGYGTAVTRAASLRARESGAAEVLLISDLANQTSNSIYLRLGYRPVGDYATIHFG
ncbi:putative acetyltransferase [Thermobispora bispora]|uniref:GCN5-related N-acetyltransferase n=1 Tax=Thermobispora bispora (strain ATCC 19993 / DSM 43833 / CBS 139.67 / JCM 10125 / KCTC 9307 / NBRC 14880 / R51) TaxID=469371 RepID=D6Y4R7_THEBD|nr:GNAT family N-acetyltransferase [Thermobispora bispora]MBO2475439.1 GNAT family N-acetyltransferase [Actinomycetales bacterium]MDI9580270.1 GNAT family N-acetyltransferase [Thermobispora sp.]ADG89243.1 GCN5-related N-acetyltransferase [Thermobispora bispora DSM 43833]MBX6166939.1 GNAT family N-acetyltransferase [Thermobispora bispora]QSI48922.1 GNAT family N-acetyltransferase [Thermobispora bispora]